MFACSDCAIDSGAKLAFMCVKSRTAAINTRLYRIQRKPTMPNPQHTPQELREMADDHYVAGRYNAPIIVAMLRAGADAMEERDRLAKLVYVPGLRKCAKCGCSLVTTNLYAETGQMSANNEPQPCPNGCGPMWPVTERDAGNRLIDDMEKVIDERNAAKKRAETAERELQSLKPGGVTTG